jgi:hypothetical protein
MRFGDMLFGVAREIPDGPHQQRVFAYLTAANEANDIILRHLGIDNSDGYQHWRSNPTIEATWKRLHPDETEGRDFIREQFANSLSGELREFALDWHDTQISRANEPDSVKEARRWVAELPAPWRGVVSPIISLPNYLWIALLMVWLVYGLARRTGPFRLIPEDAWVLQRARKKLRMEHAHVIVTSVKDREDLSVHVRVDQNPHGIQYGGATAHARVDRKVTTWITFRADNGQAGSFELVNQPFSVDRGHQMLLVTDARNGDIIFVYNHDTSEYLRLRHLKSFVKMRPWILIPLTVLTWIAALVMGVSPDAQQAIIIGTPIAYLVWIKLLNLTRREIFMKKFAPRLVEAAGSPGVANYIGTAEYGISGS